MIVWTFRLDSGLSITYYTSRRGRGAAKAHECAMALGLGDSFKLSDALNLQCRVRVEIEKGFPTVTRVMSHVDPDNSTVL
jgi:divalent metal cation (Fe/Co/Zn/Cd) transporter